VNTYGIPTYKEVNPAVFSVVTFPFLFGVMFGDVLHGLILFIFSLWMCFTKSKDVPGTLANSLAPVRYLFLLMGFFSFYCGLIYNDMTSMPVKLFGESCYTKFTPNTEGETLAYRSDPECVYPFGIDPMWYKSAQEI